MPPPGYINIITIITLCKVYCIECIAYAFRPRVWELLAEVKLSEYD